MKIVWLLQQTLDLWKEVIPGGQDFKKRQKICELHFREEDILTEFITKLPDGTEERMKRDKASLRTGAIPIFSKLDFEMCDEEERKNNLKKQEKSMFEANKFFLSENGEEINFGNIRALANKIPVPSEYWFVNSLPGFIQWTSWNLNIHEIERIVRVNENKTVNVRIYLLLQIFKFLKLFFERIK